MKNWESITLGDLGKGFVRYRPFIAILLAILLAMALLSGANSGDNDSGEVATGFESGGTVVAGAGDETETTNPEGDVIDPATGQVTRRGGTSGSGSSSNRGAGTGAAVVPGQALSVPEGSVSANCDPARGRIKVPTNFAPPCVKVNRATGNDYQGVTKDEITIVFYRGQSNAATAAALRAAGASDPEEDVRATIEAYLAYFSAHYEQYGRKIKLVYKEGSGLPDNDSAGRADAIDIATRLKAFAVIGDPNNAYVDELAARKVICICTTSQPQENYEKWAPYAGYTTLMSSTQGYVHRAEYIGKRLTGRKAKWAGTRGTPPVPMSTEDRKFGLLWFETPDGAYKAGIDFFKIELKKKYNVTLAADQAFTGAIGPGSDPAKTQEQARPAIQKMIAAGVNSLAFSGDPLSPIFFTQEATNQNYYPEWIITGSALTDTTLFARTYDTNQWQRAFGISFLTARLAEELGDPYRLHVWQHGTTPQADNSYNVIYAPIWSLFTGIHMAGPKLTPQTFAQGLFNYPVTGGYITSATISFGRHGLWDMDDYTAYDDVTEI
ncbi:MAG: hypothetical protein ACR2H3_10320, partial [Acidimicrobiales bacterium]